MPENISVQSICGQVNLSQYIGIWAVEETQFMQLFNHVANMNLSLHVNSGPEVPQVAVSTRVQDERSVSVIDISGVMTKQGSSLSDAGSTVAIRRAIRNAASDPNIAAIVLRIDSPGGSVAGTADLAAEVKSADAKKPVYTYVEDLMASAGYWTGSQARKIYANNGTAQIGSIGTYIGTYDYSGKAEKEGIKAVVVKSGAVKGAGFPGTEITDEQIAVWQGIVDKVQSQFSQAVSEGRNIPLSKVQELATGQVYMADDALSFGLIDKIGSFDEMLADLQQEIKAGQNVKRRSMMTTEAKEAATIEEIQTACPKADEKFVLDVLKKKMTLEDAKSAYIENLQAQVEIREQEAASEREKAETAAKNAKKPGVDASLESGGKPASQPYSGGFEELVMDLMSKQNLTRQKAVVRAAKQDPEGHKEYLLEHNTKRKSREQIEDRFSEIA